MRLLLKWCMQPQEWTGKSDSPTAMTLTINMLVAIGVDPADPDIVDLADNVVSTGDVSTAFLVADDYGHEEQARYVGYKP